MDASRFLRTGAVGDMPGTYTLLVRRHDGLSWAVLFNQRSDDKRLPDAAIDPALHRAADAVDSWPDVDLFEPPVGPSRVAADQLRR